MRKRIWQKIKDTLYEAKTIERIYDYKMIDNMCILTSYLVTTDGKLVRYQDLGVWSKEKEDYLKRENFSLRCIKK